MQGYLSEVG